MRLVLDAEAVSALLDPRHPAERRVRHAMEAASRLRRDVTIATGTLAELYRGAGRNQALDALLARESGNGLLLRDTDRGRAGAWCRRPIPMTSADLPRHTGRSPLSRWPEGKAHQPEQEVPAIPEITRKPWSAR